MAYYRYPRPYTQRITSESGVVNASVAKTTFIVVSLTLMCTLLFMLQNVYRVQKKVADLQQEIAKSQQLLLAEISKVQEMSAITATSNRKTLKTLREELEIARHEVEKSAGQTKVDAVGNVQRLAKELKSAELQQNERHEQVKRQLSDMSQGVAKADEKITGVSADVTNVRNEVAETQTFLKKAVFDLKQVVGDMGVMSGRIATNAKELELLKAVGDRNYTEFHLTKGKEALPVGNVGVLLKKTDPSRRKYTVELVIEDARVQKRDKTVNEPVQFYVSRNKQPYEIVVNQITKDKIDGYLATPKVELQRQ